MTEKITEEEKYINKFKNEFVLKFGYYPEINNSKRKYVTKKKNDLDTLLKKVNRYLKINYKIKEGIQADSRKGELVNLRRIYCMLSYDLGYTYKEIGDKIGARDHTTIGYNLKTGYDFLETNKDFRDLYIIVSTSINPQLYPHARINKIPDTEQDNSKSTGITRMHSRGYNVTRPGTRKGKRFEYIKKGITVS